MISGKFADIRGKILNIHIKQVFTCLNIFKIFLLNLAQLLGLFFNQKNVFPRHCLIGNCDIDFFNFRHWKVQILSLFKRSWYFAVIFQEYRKQNQKSTKYFTISRKASVIPLKFCEMPLVLWNLINFCQLL